MSGVRTLFVDDDQMLLTSMERCLGLQFDVTTALSGPEGLAKIESEPPFPVIITDMRMPGMDGLAFIDRAREISKNSVFVMLTGNQDVQTAINAVNQGQVFRFLNKPTDPSDIAATIEQAKRQFDLEAAERDLLNQTFVGAVGLFADVMEILQPELLGRAGSVEQLVEQLREQCSIAARWEYKIAAKLSMIGFALHGDRTAAAADENETDEDAQVKALSQLTAACVTSSHMVDRIPRLSAVSAIIGAVPTARGRLERANDAGEGDVVALGATLLRVAHLVEGLAHVGVDPDQVENELRKQLPNVDDEVAEAAVSIYPHRKEETGVPVEPKDLRPGMVLFDNLTRSDGATLLRSGRRLSEAHIQKLQSEVINDFEYAPIVVTRGSFAEAYPEAQPA